MQTLNEPQTDKDLYSQADCAVVRADLDDCTVGNKSSDRKLMASAVSGVSYIELEEVVSCSTSDGSAGTGELLLAHCAGVTDVAGSTVSEVLPTTCTDDVMETSSVDSFRQVVPVERSPVSATRQGHISCSDEEMLCVTDADVEPAGISATDSTGAGRDTADEISDVRTRDNSADNRVFRKSGSADIPGCVLRLVEPGNGYGCGQSAVIHADTNNCRTALSRGSELALPSCSEIGDVECGPDVSCSDVRNDGLSRGKLPATHGCDSMKTAVKTSVDDFYRDDIIECSTFSVTACTEKRCSHENDGVSSSNMGILGHQPITGLHFVIDSTGVTTTGVADPDHEPAGISSADCTGSDTDHEITASQTNSRRVTRDISADNHVLGKLDNTDIPTRRRLSLSQRRERKPGSKQSYDKIHYCKFCGNKIRSKISRHLLSVHADDAAVKEILFLPKRSKERRARLQRLINEGNFSHNIAVIRNGEGDIVVGKRLSNTSAYDYTACEFCRRFESKRNLWRHMKSCSARAEYCKDTGDENGSRLLAVRRGNSLVANAAFARTGEHTKELFERMRADDVKAVVVSDDLICREAELRMAALGSERRHDDIYRISQVARTLGRVVQLARLSVPTATLSKLIEPQSFDLLVEIAKKMSTDKERPSVNVARTVALLLKKACVSKFCSALHAEDMQAQQDAMSFKQLLEREWNNRVNHTVVKKVQPDALTSTDSKYITSWCANAV